jgi:polysaccharide biosynthesis/export protein
MILHIKLVSMKSIRLIVIVAMSVSFFSCKTQQKTPYYLEARKDTAGKNVVVIPELLIQKNDLLSVQIFSLSTEPKADAIYNMPTEGAAGTQSGYWVDMKGNITHHRLGVIHAEGLTKDQFAEEIKKRLTQPVELLKSPTVIVRLLNFKVNILGQVGKEGPISVPGDRMTILEAIAMAGGISDYGKRDSVKIYREKNGLREMGIVDLSSDSVFHSPYFNLMQNDFIVIGQTKLRMKEQDQQRVFQKITMGLTLVAAAATLTSIFFRN